MQHTQASIHALLDQLNTVVVGKPQQVRDCVACLLSGGHLLIEDLPGVGKTTLAHALARSLGLEFARVQFTSDLMPSDLLGVSIYERQQGSFLFQPGPIFTQVLLADEINRASPKTQSALLEAMEEHQVSAEGQTHPLPRPFFVIATQNPQEQIGTHALPESQLDRFLMRISLGYPDAQAERQLLAHNGHRSMLSALPALVSAEELQNMQQEIIDTYASEHVLTYLQQLLHASRDGHWFVQGLSPRAGIAWLRAAKACAWLDGRDYVAPDDVQAIAVQCMAHRLHAVPASGKTSAQQLQALLAHIPIP